jgi:hypothetical protein
MALRDQGTSPFLPWDGMAFRPTKSPTRSGCVSQDHARPFMRDEGEEGPNETNA